MSARMLALGRARRFILPFVRASAHKVVARRTRRGCELLLRTRPPREWLASRTLIHVAGRTWLSALGRFTDTLNERRW